LQQYSNKKGELAMDTKEKIEIWKEYFDKMLNTGDAKELINPLPVQFKSLLPGQEGAFFSVGI
jgi:uncharacterized protein YqeY